MRDNVDGILDFLRREVVGAARPITCPMCGNTARVITFPDRPRFVRIENGCHHVFQWLKSSKQTVH
jgi:hypothetical protein